MSPGRLKLVVSAAARLDLIGIGDGIASDNVSGALAFVTAIEQRCRKLLDAPRSCPVVPRHEASGVRRAIYGNYLIFYRVGQRQVEIIRVLHGARDYERILLTSS